MKVESQSFASAAAAEMIRPAEAISEERKKAQAEPSVSVSELKSQQEEVLEKIKELTEDGKYSVRFEMDSEVSQLVISLFDNEGSLIRQIPSEELLDALKSLHDFRGNFVDAAS